MLPTLLVPPVQDIDPLPSPIQATEVGVLYNQHCIHEYKVLCRVDHGWQLVALEQAAQQVECIALEIIQAGVHIRETAGR